MTELNWDDVEISLVFLGFFDSESDADVRGAAMVTNKRGFPGEFQVSTPVRPSPVQRALYGASLEPYITADLLGTRLLDDLKSRIDLVLVNRLGGLEIDCDSSVAFVAKADSYVQQQDPARKYRRLEAQGEETSAIALVCTNDKTLEEATLMLSEAMRYFDPADAFARMNTALDVLAESDERYR